MIRYHDLQSECSESVLSKQFSGSLTLHWQSPGGHWHAATAEDFLEADRLARSVLSPPTPYSPSLVWISPLTGAPARGWPSR